MHCKVTQRTKQIPLDPFKITSRLMCRGFRQFILQKNRFVKHVKCERNVANPQKSTNNDPVQMTIISKQMDSRGNIYLITVLDTTI